VTAAVRAIFLRLRGLRQSPTRENETAEELRYDLDMRIQEGERAGLSHAESRRRALIQLGGLEQTMQSVRDRRTLPVIEALMQDLRFAMRQLRNRAGFTITVVLTLALGFGASLAISAFADAALLRPLPYANPDRLAWVTEEVDRMGPANLSLPDYLDWKQMAQSFESFAAWRFDGHILRTGDTSIPADAMRITANFLTTLGLRPQLGRDLRDEDNLAGAAKVVLISDTLWRKTYSANPNIVGQALSLDGVSYSVIGVLPRNFEFAPRGRLDLMIALQPAPTSCETRRGCHSLVGVARLKPGVTIEQADSEVKRIANILSHRYPDTNTGQRGVAKMLSEQAIGKIRPVLATLFAGAALLFAIAYVNVASLLVARSESRTREFSLRTALGASRGRLLRQFAAEASVLVALGLLGGVLLAHTAIHLLLTLVPEPVQRSMPFFAAVGWTPHVIVFGVMLAVAAAAVFIAVPILRITSTRLRSGLNEGSAGSGSLGWRRIGSMLVMAEVATAVVLLVGAGLLARSLMNLLNVDLAFVPDHLVAVSVNAPPAYFKADADQLAVQRAVVEHVRTLPGVVSAGFGQTLPASFNGNTVWVRFVGRPYDGHHIEVDERTASPTYFQTLGTRLLQGRFFTEDDTPGKQKVVIVNKRFAEAYYPGEDPIGKQFGNIDLKPDSIKVIVGVVDNLHEGALDDDLWPAVYTPAYQDVDNSMAMLVRVSGDGHTMLPMLTSSIRNFNRELDTFSEVTMSDRIHDSQSAAIHRGAAWLAGAFAVLALLLCVIGLYGVVSYSVSLRSREIGVRMALGAQRSAIYRLVLGEAVQLSGIGLALGIGLAIGVATLLRALLFHVSAWDGTSLAGAAVVLGACSLLASLLPAHRAAACNPNEALRTE
jgi:macrolide transport system ATP-binding/permease protein